VTVNRKSRRVKGTARGVEWRMGRYAICRERNVALDTTLLSDTADIDFTNMVPAHFAALLPIDEEKWNQWICELVGENLSITGMSFCFGRQDAVRPKVDIDQSKEQKRWVPISATESPAKTGTKRKPSPKREEPARSESKSVSPTDPGADKSREKSKKLAKQLIDALRSPGPPSAESSNDSPYSQAGDLYARAINKTCLEIATCTATGQVRSTRRIRGTDKGVEWRMGRYAICRDKNVALDTSLLPIPTDDINFVDMNPFHFAALVPIGKDWNRDVATLVDGQLTCSMFDFTDRNVKSAIDVAQSAKERHWVLASKGSDTADGSPTGPSPAPMLPSRYQLEPTATRQPKS
jgi:hypothetical protein